MMLNQVLKLNNTQTFCWNKKCISVGGETARVSGFGN